MIFIKYLNYVCNNELLLAVFDGVYRVIQGASRDEMVQSIGLTMSLE